MYNLDYHQKRVNQTLKHFYGNKSHLDLYQIIENINLNDNLSKLRISYDDLNYNYTIEPYKRRNIEKLIPVFDDKIEYRFKYEDRNCFTAHLHNIRLKYGDLAEPLYIVDGYVTDTSFSNVAFFDGHKWVTPSTYLLKGTKREELIKSGLLIEKDILFKDINRFEKVSLINSMNDIGEIELQIDALKDYFLNKK